MNFRLNGRRLGLLSSVAGGVFLALAPLGVAQAQDQAASAEDAANEDEAIIITGFRASLRSSTETKREADSIVEVVTAEEIGRLPDNSIAESISRLPGVTSQRLFGRSQNISVRGLSPDFTSSLLNGREQVSAGDNRGVEFDQYPSELLSSVVVYKTPTPSLIGQGLAGTVDLRTVRPLAYDDRVFAANARYEWNDRGALVSDGEDTGYRATLSYIDQSDDRRWGWAIGVATLSSPTQAERFEAWGYPTTGAGDFIIGGAKPYVQSSLLERDAIMGVLEFRPTNAFSARIDAFYSEYNEEQDLKGIEFPLWWSSATLQPGATVDDGLVVAGTFSGVDGVVRNDIRTRQSTISAIGLNLEWDVGDLWTLGTDVSYSSVSRDDLDLETYSGTGPGGAGATATLNFQTGNGSYIFDSNIDYSDPSLILLTDPQGWGQAGFIKEPQTDDELRALRLTAERRFENGAMRSMEVGINYSEREKDKTSIEAFLDLPCGPGPADNNQCTVAIPSNLLTSPTALDFLGIPGMVSYDPEALLNSGVYSIRPNTNADVISKTWGVEERVTVAYVQLNLDHRLGGVPVTGNAGIQFVHTDQSSTGAVRDSSAAGFTVVEQGDEYVEMLPSLNLSFAVTEDSSLRLGIARTLARARMDQMRASFEVGYNIPQIGNPNPTPSLSYWGGSGGNPLLRPWIADSIDISYEHYFDNSDGYVAVAGFYKYLESFIYQQFIPYDFTGFPSHDGVSVPASFQGFANAPANGEGGYIRGLEFTANIPAELLFRPLEGFGVVVNASFTDSDIEPPDSPNSALPGLSETVVNTTIYYEYAGFEARVSNRYRTDFLGEVTGFGAGRELRFIEGESILDAQIGYRFGGALEGLGVLFQANNLTDEPFSGYFGDDERLVRDYQTYGTTYLFGLSYRR